MTHLKRLRAPKTWAVTKKTSKWITRPEPGVYTGEYSIPIVIALRDMLNYAKTSREVKKILNNESILVNGRKVKDHRYVLGFMDVLEIPDKKEVFRLNLNKKGKFTLEKIDAADYLYERIENKRILNKGVVQLNFLSGRNINVKDDIYKVGDVLKISLKDNKITDRIELKMNTPVIIIDGSHIGEVAVLEEIDSTKFPKEAVLRKDDIKIKTRFSNVFAIEGKNE